MKTSQSAVRRLALLASSSFGALGLVMLTGGAAALTPAKALAADECGVQATDGDPIVCLPGTYPTGITYFGGTVPVTVRDGVTVSDGGIDLTGTTSVGLTAQTVTANAGDLQVTNTAGAGLSLTGGSVNVDLTDADSGDTSGSITGTSGVNATGNGLNLNFGDVAITGTDINGYGVYATSTGGGSAFINATGDISSAGIGLRADFDGSYNSFSLGNVSGQQAALVLNSTMTGGWGYSQVDVNGNATGDVIASTADGTLYIFTIGVTGNLQGSSTGAGQIGFVLKGPIVGNVDVSSMGSGGGFANLFGENASLTGDLTVTAQNGGSAFANLSAPVVGNIDVTANRGGFAGVETGDVTGVGTPITLTADTGDASLSLGGTVTGTSGYAAKITAGGSVQIGISAGVTASQSDFDITVGDRLTFSNSGTFTGPIDFSIAPGGGAFYNSSTWEAAPITFTGADDALDNNNGGMMRFGNSATYNFQGGNDQLTNTAILVIGAAPGPSTLTLVNLESLTNYSPSSLSSSSAIIFGSTDGLTSDGETNDRLVANGTAFVGGYSTEFAGTLLMDVNFSGRNQMECSAAVVADCMSLVGGSATGSTVIHVNDAGGPSGSLNRIVLIDLHGGTSDPNAFRLPSINPIEKGLFYYRLQYDAANQQWVLAGYAGRSIYQFSEVATTAQNLWYDSAQAWTDLSADDRDQEGASGPAIWLKATKNDIDRAAEISPAQRDQIAPYNVGYSGDVKAYVGGVDILRGDGYVAGLMLGHQDADIAHKASTNRTRLKGENYAAYGRWSGGRFFVDGIVQLSRLDLLQTGDWNTGGDVGKGKVKSTGAQVDAGARFPISDRGMTIEPLASLAYVTTKIDDLALPGAGGSVRYDDPKSLRGGLGARVSGSYSVAGGRLRMSATGRAWKEFEGDYKVAVLSAGNTLEFGDDFSGTFEELGVSVSYSLPNSGLSAFVNGNSKWKENYTDSSVALGVRMSW
ncbi:MAG: autotransporter outer membrane beta-barrel domain-containing protein [Ignavibacteriales bacterium]